MKKNLKQLVMVLILAIMIFPASVRAEGNNCFGDDLKGADQEAFSTLIDEIQCIKEAHPEFNDERILEIIDQNHTKFERGISDIWNSLTDSEKKLCIRYPFAALKVNTAKNIATSKTESKFGMNGLGDRSDAFRHGIWNAEMTILIGKEKAELFAKVRAGQVRILLGSTPKLGAGTNIQDRLIALHHLDCPWKPSDLERAPVKAS